MDGIKQRDHYFDNLKILLIAAVVIGHIIEPLISTHYKAKFLYILIYTFHMPLFAFVSGYFNKNSKSSNPLIKVLIPYVVFQFLYLLFNRYMLGDVITPITFTTPYWIMWYLLSLFIWQLIGPLFNFKYSIVVALIAGILIGYDSNVSYYLSLSRTFYFFPFFLMGYKFNKDKFFTLIPKRAQKVIPVIGLICIVIIIYIFADQIIIRLLFGSYAYVSLDLTKWYAGVYRLFVYTASIITSIFILYLIPNKKMFFSTLGARTLNVYLLHGFIMKLLLKYNFYSYLDTNWKRWTLIPLGIIITFILSLKIFDFVVNPFPKKFLEKKISS